MHILMDLVKELDPRHDLMRKVFSGAAL
jgi:hypothetical protein